MRPHLVRGGAQIAAVAALYYGAAKLGLSMASDAEQVTAVWPPTGIALAATVLLGYRIWPGITLGAFLANLTAHEPVATACGIAAGNTLEALLGAWLLQHWEFRPSLQRLRDVLALLLLAAMLSPVVSATIGVTSLLLGGLYPWSSFTSLWWVWWLGDAVGNVVVAPVLLTWVVWLQTKRRLPRAGEMAALLVGLTAVCSVVFTVGPSASVATHPLAYTIFPFAIWAALRHGPLATTLASLVASAIAIGGTVYDLGPFGQGTPHERLIGLMIFLGVVTISALVVAAATEERNAAERHRAAGYAVAQALAEASTLEGALSRVLQAVCKSLGWDLGALWHLDPPANVMSCVEVWRNPSAPIGAFEAITRQTTFAPGIGLPGRVWVSRQPIWVANVALDPNFPRRAIADQNRVHGAFGFPVVLGNRVLGVVEFFSREVRMPDDELLRMMASVGSQLGLFVERKRAEEALRESEERLRLALDAGKIGAWDWDIAKDQVTWSERIFEFHGMPPGSFGGKVADFTRLIHPDDSARVREAIQRAVDQRMPYEMEFRIVRPSGEVRWIATNGRVLYDPAGRPVRMLGAALDTTARKEAEQALREADRRKDEFLAMLAHELRNPLAPIQNGLYILRRPTADPAAVQLAHEIMERQMKHLTRLVDDLLDVSRITRGKIHLRRELVDLATIVQDATAAVKPLLHAQKHELSVYLPEPTLRLEVDPLRLEQVLTNLLNNAAKYTEPGGRIWLTCERDRDSVVIRVRDSGIGIHPELLPRVFDLFAQADRALDRSQGGLGIGLTLVRRLVELHGGTVVAHSDGPGKGSEFVVRLPQAVSSGTPFVPAAPYAEARSSDCSPANVQSDCSSRRILVVDDNVDAAESLAVLLRSWGHEVRLAHDGLAALKTANAFAPEIGLLDIGLPGMNGYEVAERLREETGRIGCVLVALTGYGQERDRRQSLERGFDHHLVKPVDPSALRELLESFSPSSQWSP